MTTPFQSRPRNVGARRYRYAPRSKPEPRDCWHRTWQSHGERTKVEGPVLNHVHPLSSLLTRQTARASVRSYVTDGLQVSCPGVRPRQAQRKESVRKSSLCKIRWRSRRRGNEYNARQRYELSPYPRKKINVYIDSFYGRRKADLCRP